jgi:golgi apyrase
MRLLPDNQRNALLEEICTYARKHTSFQLPDCDLHIQVIKGETEGLYGWIAANYLIGGFDADATKHHDHGAGHHTYGFLDMGGASAQIAFVPNATESKKHHDDLTLLRLRTIGGDDIEHNVYSTTWLEFGVREARRRYLEFLKDQFGDTVIEMLDPCLPKGLKLTEEGTPVEKGSAEDKGKKPYLLGTGEFSSCVKHAYPLLGKDKPCNDSPCLLNGVHSPAIDFKTNHFVGVSEYWHTTHRIFEMGHKDTSYDFHSYQHLVEEFCSQHWDEIQENVKNEKWRKVDEEDAMEVCFKASWLINVLHDGIGVPRVALEHSQTSPPISDNDDEEDEDEDEDEDEEDEEDALERPDGFLDPFQAVNKIHGVEVSWTLGKMVLYAASQIPPASEPAELLPVGFGPNNEVDAFQQAGGSPLQLPDDLVESDDDSFSMDSILSVSSSRRIPGMFLFIVIVAVLGFLLCGRNRRRSFNRRIRRVFGLPASSPGSFRRGKSYSPDLALLEGGPGPAEFEVDDEEAPRWGYPAGSGPHAALMGPYEEKLSSSSSSLDGGARRFVGRSSGWATPGTEEVMPGSTMAQVGPSPTSAPGSVSGLGIASPRGFAHIGPILRASSGSPARQR